MNINIKSYNTKLYVFDPCNKRDCLVFILCNHFRFFGYIDKEKNQITEGCRLFGFSFELKFKKRVIWKRRTKFIRQLKRTTLNMHGGSNNQI